MSAQGLSSDVVADVTEDDALLDVRHLVQEYVIESPGQGRRRIQAVSDVSFSIQAGETLGLVGETGCGKSSLVRTILQLNRPRSGQVWFHGVDLSRLKGKALRRQLRGLQVVFQDPYTSLDPRWSVEALLTEPLRVNHLGSRADQKDQVMQLLEDVGLDSSVHADRKPRELSGGQCQRVAIARALALQPQLMVCDEPVSALDVSVQAQILNLFEKLQRDYRLSYLFVTHDLSVAKHVSDRIVVMYLGKIVEIAPSKKLFTSPLHPYAVALLSAIPSYEEPARERIVLTGDAPSPSNPPSACRFRTRCPHVQDICAQEEPPLREHSPGHYVACHFPNVG